MIKNMSTFLTLSDADTWDYPEECLLICVEGEVILDGDKFDPSEDKQLRTLFREATGCDYPEDYEPEEDGRTSIESVRIFKVGQLIDLYFARIQEG